MQELSPKLHRSRSLASAGLGAALAVLIVGASAPRAAAQSYNFNNQSDSAWTHYDFGDPPSSLSDLGALDLCKSRYTNN